MDSRLTVSVVGLLPAIIFPVATAIQVVTVYSTDNVAGVSAWTWFLFGLANFGAYIFSEKYTSFQAVSAFLVTALLDMVIVARVLLV